MFLYFVLCSEERRILGLSHYAGRSFALAMLRVFLGVRYGYFHRARVLRDFQGYGARFDARVGRVISDVAEDRCGNDIIRGQGFLLPGFFHQGAFGLSGQPRVCFCTVLLYGIMVKEFL